MRPSIARANEQLDPRQQLANTPPPQSTTPGLHPVSIHQMAPPKRTSNCSILLIYRPRKDERLSWPSWLTCFFCSGRFTHIVVTRRLQAERRTESVRRPKSGVPPTVLRNQAVQLRTKMNWLDVEVRRSEVKVTMTPIMVKKLLFRCTYPVYRLSTSTSKNFCVCRSQSIICPCRTPSDMHVGRI